MRILLFLLCFPFFATAQIIKGSVVNSENGKPIPYASLGIEETEFGTACDSLGNFTLNLDKADQSRPLKVSAMGYESKNFPLNGDLNLIKLARQAIQLPEVNITAKKAKNATIGSFKESGKIFVTYNPSKRAIGENKGTALGMTFSVPRNKQYFLKDFKFAIRPSGFEELKFRLIIEDASTHQNLLPKDIFVTWNKGKELSIMVKLAEYAIEVQKDFLVALEWVDYKTNESNTQQNISLPASLSLSSNTWRKRGAQDSWHEIKKAKLGFELNVGISEN